MARQRRRCAAGNYLGNNSPGMSVRQTWVRHIDEPWFGEANRPVDQTEK